MPESDHLTGLDPLNWWSVNATNYPIISVLAKKYLAIPASSASSERVFSTAKNITDKKRWRLLPEQLHKTIFLRHNQYFWKYMYASMSSCSVSFTNLPSPSRILIDSALASSVRSRRVSSTNCRSISICSIACFLSWAFS